MRPALTWNANGTLAKLAITDGFNSSGTQTCNFGTASPAIAGYDDMGRLLSANCGSVWSQTFSYDRYGNITKSGSSAWVPGYDAATNRYTLSGVSYDNDGNLLNDTFHGYTWDVFGKLLTVDSTTTLTSDAFGRVVEKSVSGTYSEIEYGPTGKVAVMNGSTQKQAYVPLPGGEMLSPGPDTFWHTDWLGTVRLASSVSSRTVTFDRAFAPFGEMYNTVTGGTTNPNFTGDTQDTISGEFDTLFRELHPGQGRWISPDPAGLAAADPMNPQSWNHYAYVLNNPLALIDPLGLGDCSDGSKSPDGDDCNNTVNGSGASAPLVVSGDCWGSPDYAIYGSCWDSVAANVDDGSGPPLKGYVPSTKFIRNGGGAANNCVTPSKVQSAVIPVAATAAKFWNKTVMWGLGGSGGAGFGKGFGMYGTFSVQIAVSPNGNAAYVITFAAPATVSGTGTYMWVTPSTKGAGILGGSQFGFSNATDPSQLAGPGVDASGSLAAGLGIGVDSSVSIGGNFPYTFNVTLGFGAGGRGSAGAATNTTVIPICHN